MARLPREGEDNWGGVLNEFLTASHNNDGTLKSAALSTRMPVFNVQDYGAKGDGAADDRSAIQSALEAAYRAGGGTVFIPAGTFAVGPGLQVKSNVTLAGTGAGSVIKLKDGSTRNDNIIKSENWVNVAIKDLTLDGNRANQPGGPGSYRYTQYGVYFGNTHNSLVQNVVAHDTTGVGIHVYDSKNVTVQHCVAMGNNYHGYELEQAIGCRIMQSRGSGNLLHGVLVSPGEIGGSGAKGNTVSGCMFDDNGNYGIAENAANDDMSAFLNEGNLYESNTVINNSHYGVNFYKQNKGIFNNNYVAGNGFFGLFMYQASFYSVQGNMFIGNSQAGEGLYDEIMLDGAASGRPSHGNTIAGNTILVNTARRSRFAINEGNDGPNIIVNNVVPLAGTEGAVHIANPATLKTGPAGTLQVYGGQGLHGQSAGLDNAFNVLRIYSSLPNSEVQVVSETNGLNVYSFGKNVLTAFNDMVTVRDKLVLPKAHTPAGANAPGETGQIAWDADYMYVCTAPNTWRWCSLSTW